MKLLLEVKIPTLPPSANRIYAPANIRGTASRRGYSTIVMTKEAVNWIKQATLFLPPARLPDHLPLRMETAYHASWYTMAGEIRKKDVRNYEKLVTDTVFRRYGLDDKLVFESLVTKVDNSDQEYVIVKLYTIKEPI